MAQFYAEIHGNRGAASRQGTAKSGLSGHIRGWGIGARVHMTEENGEDVCYVYLTSGSHNHHSSRFLGKFTAKEFDK